MEPANLDDLLKEKSKHIFRYLIKLGVSKSDAEDIVQDTLYKTLLSIHELQIDKLTPWMFRVAYNAHIDLIRKKKRRGELPLEAVDLISHKSLDEEVLSLELKAEIKSIIDQLNPVYRHMLVLKYEYDLSHREIAAITGIKEESVKVSMFRARGQFKEAYRRMTDEREKRI